MPLTVPAPPITILPFVVSVGSSFSSTGAPTATLPATHALNDILILALQSSNDSSVAVAGYTQLGPQSAIGAASTAATTKLSLFWKRDGGAEAAPTIPDTGDHTFGVMFAVRGCPTVGDPFHFLGNTFKFITSLAGTSPKGTTVIDNCLVVDIWGQGVDSAAAQGSSPTNADLGSVTEQFDGGTADGTGGGIYIMSGTKAAAGDIVASTVTWANTTVDVSSRIAFIPENTTEINNSPKPVQVQVFIGTPADLDDLWVKPSGATFVRAQVCDGGGSGSGGNTTGTAAGGGGGGGGGYGEAQYLAAALAASITVHAGKGGAAVALGAGGNQGVVSQFDKGGVGPLTSAYRVAGVAATAAITADGGNGGCGSGVASQAVVTTRIALGAGTPNVGAGGIGAAGGSGTIAPVGGSESESGGGGGESGADSDAAILSANNGNSRYGAGGGREREDEREHLRLRCRRWSRRSHLCPGCFRERFHASALWWLWRLWWRDGHGRRRIRGFPWWRRRGRRGGRKRRWRQWRTWLCRGDDVLLMRRIFSLALLVFSVLAVQSAGAESKPQLTSETTCLRAEFGTEPNYFSVLFIGVGTQSEVIEWSPDNKFRALGGSSALEGESGVLIFYTNRQGSSGDPTLIYPDGVWARWAQGSQKKLHVEIPPVCREEGR